MKRLFLQVFADAPAHGEPDDRAGARADVCTHRCADAVAQRGPDFEAELHSDGCPERAAELAALVEAHVYADVTTNQISLRTADEVERAPLNVVVLCPHPTRPTRPSLNSPPSRPPRCNTGSI